MTERSEARSSNRIRRAPISLVTAGPDARTVRAQTRTHRMTDYLNSPSRVQVSKLLLIRLSDFRLCE
jgi:hypothetical protein